MATEIELKARVPDSGALKQVLAGNAGYLAAFEKDDRYWVSCGGGPGCPVQPLRLRVRREKRVLPSGDVEYLCSATWKDKEVKDGIEINSEKEFGLLSPAGTPGPEFGEFLQLAGFKPEASKRKTGWAFSRGGITAELALVEGLGWFIELEILAGDMPAGAARDKAAEEGKKRLLDFLRRLGIAEDAVESRSYTAMLEEAASGASV